MAPKDKTQIQIVQLFSNQTSRVWAHFFLPLTACPPIELPSLLLNPRCPSRRRTHLEFYTKAPIPSPMIQVENLTKRYAGFTAVRDISFQVSKGEIVGFLGPNGAGKSTTMRMLTGYLPPTAGSAKIAGFDIFEKSTEARRHIGYLPESTPLYHDMRVSEYLRYRASLKGVESAKLRERVGDVLEMCNLQEKERSLIGTLSKGQRQRVGLADALVHDPDLLILDEPTIGLDPNQIRQVRELIKNLAHRRTVLISTHILPEVEIMCSRVIVIHKGRIRASDTAANLLSKHRVTGAVRVELGAPSENTLSAFTALSGVKQVSESKTESGTVYLLRTDAEADPSQEVVRLATEGNWKLQELSRRKPTLEDVFVDLTQGD
jgi:ABC-2 type transport system ATP-binding protein